MFTTFVMAFFFRNNEQGQALLKRGRRLAPDMAVGAALGIVVFLLIYGPSTLNPTYDSWVYAGYIEQDIIQRYAGWLYFRAADWSWPLTVAENVTQPYGASIAFTDSIPLLAILLKSVSRFLPETFQFFGLLNLANFALQGLFAVLLLREVGLGRWQAALGSLVFILAPVFIERAFRHDCLGTQWIILWALWLYLRARHTGRIHAVSFWLLCTFTPAIHTYFTPMVYAVLVAVLADYIIRERKWVRPAATLAACFGGSLVVAYAIGLLTRGGGGSGDGFGRYSMNLNALFNPTSFDWYAENDSLVWSRFIPVQGQEYFQYDGFNYLGLGLLLALAVLLVCGAVALARGRGAALRRAAAFVKGHLPLLVVCVCLGVFALSNVVRIGNTTLFTVPLPAFILNLCGIFRSSGRMFWPVYYLLVLVAVVGISRLLRGRGVYLGLAALLAVQLADTGGVLVAKHAYFNNGPVVAEDEFTTEGWQFLMENYTEVRMLRGIIDHRLAVNIIRYNPAMTTNLVITNRGTFPLVEQAHMADTVHISTGGEIAPGVLYLIDVEDMFYTILAGAHEDVRGYQVGDWFLLGIPVAGCPLEEISA